MPKYFRVSKKQAIIQLYAITAFILVGLTCLLILSVFAILQEYQNQNYGVAIIFSGLGFFVTCVSVGITFSFKEKRKKLLDMPDNEDVILKMPD